MKNNFPHWKDPYQLKPQRRADAEKTCSNCFYESIARLDDRQRLNCSICLGDYSRPGWVDKLQMRKVQHARTKSIKEEVDLLNKDFPQHCSACGKYLGPHEIWLFRDKPYCKACADRQYESVKEGHHETDPTRTEGTNSENISPAGSANTETA